MNDELIISWSSNNKEVGLPHGDYSMALVSEPWTLAHETLFPVPVPLLCGAPQAWVCACRNKWWALPTPPARCHFNSSMTQNEEGTTLCRTLLQRYMHRICTLCATLWLYRMPWHQGHPPPHPNSSYPRYFFGGVYLAGNIPYSHRDRECITQFRQKMLGVNMKSTLTGRFRYTIIHGWEWKKNWTARACVLDFFSTYHIRIPYPPYLVSRIRIPETADKTPFSVTLN